jgi:hypothetical protein
MLHLDSKTTVDAWRPRLTILRKFQVTTQRGFVARLFVDMLCRQRAEILPPAEKRLREDDAPDGVLS